MEQSTSLHELGINPVTVLLRSAMCVSPIELAVWWIAFSLVVAPRGHRFMWRRVFAALATYHGSVRRRLLWAAGLVAAAAGGMVLDFGWTAIGHAIAVLLGFACYRLVNPDAAVHHEARVRARRLYGMEH